MAPTHRTKMETSADLFALEELWGSVRWRAAPGVELLSVLEVVAEAKIRNLGVQIKVKQEVLSLQVTMNHLEQERGRR